MCWNASVSLNTYLLGVFASCLALFNGVIGVPAFLFMMSFVHMQLVEYFVWSQTFSNRALSMAAFVLILVQPLVAVFEIERRRDLVVPLACAYCAFVLALLTVVYPWNKVDFRMVPAANGHLAWHWLKFPSWCLLAWMAVLFAPVLLNKKYVRLAIGIGVVATIYVLYRDTYTWGSLWCWIANALSLYLIYKVFRKELC